MSRFHLSHGEQPLQSDWCLGMNRSLVKGVCIICDSITEFANTVFRNETVACSSCLKKKQDLVDEIELKLGLRKFTKKLGADEIVGITVWFCLIAKLIEWLISKNLHGYTIFFFLAFVFGIVFTFRFKRKKRLRRKLQNVVDILVPIYDEMWEIPPDWHMRRIAIILRDSYRCRECGRQMSKSTMSFHVHHIVPKAGVRGNHKIDNLKLLCEVCHRKQPFPGHELMGEGKRHKGQEVLISKRRYPTLDIWLRAYGLSPNLLIKGKSI